MMSMHRRADRRNGDLIHVDYLRQFSGEKAPKAPRAARGTGARKKAAPKEDGGGGAGGASQGHWITEGGAKVGVRLPSCFSDERALPQGPLFSMSICRLRSEARFLGSKCW